jgi:hypothetical protein
MQPLLALVPLAIWLLLALACLPFVGKLLA